MELSTKQSPYVITCVVTKTDTVYLNMFANVNSYKKKFWNLLSVWRFWGSIWSPLTPLPTAITPWPSLTSSQWTEMGRAAASFQTCTTGQKNFRRLAFTSGEDCWRTLICVTALSDCLLVSTRTLLWHGSRLSNWVGILSRGLRVAPPEAPVTGYMVRVDLC